MGAVARLLGIADLPADDDDTRVRKRVGVAAGYLTLVAPLALPVQGNGSLLSWALAVGLPAFTALNLAVLRSTRRFERYVIALIGAGALFVPLATIVGGGLTGSTTGLAWGFLVPAYAIMALGPRRATPWLMAWLGGTALLVLIDPLVHAAAGATPYAEQLFAIVVNTVAPLVIVFLLLRYSDLRRRAAEARVDELLLNAIPSSIVVRLKGGERRIAEAYPDTTVVFADIVGFTPWAQRTPPARVVDLLDALFVGFDDVIGDHGLEKIKTIGDAYMAVAGAPEPRGDHALAGVTCAAAWLHVVRAWRDEHNLDLEVRIGVASGPVVGGVIGDRRLLFDLWGDTVNLAARMESSGVPGRIQVSPSTRDRIADRVELEPREVDVKGLGPIRAWLVVHPEELAARSGDLPTP